LTVFLVFVIVSVEFLIGTFVGACVMYGHLKDRGKLK
jgi:hypothetical protein